MVFNFKGIINLTKIQVQETASMEKEHPKLNTSVTKEIFYKLLNKDLAEEPYCTMKLFNFPFNKNKIDMIKSCIEKCSFLANTEKEWCKKFKILNQNGRKILAVQLSSIEIREVVAVEDCFEPLMEIHLKEKHTMSTRALELLSNNYYIPLRYLELIPLACNVCNEQAHNFGSITKNIQQLTTLKDYAEIHLVSMLIKDHCFSHLLIYLNKSNGYVMLRPLLTKSASEVAAELLKIFLDFYPPNFIYYSGFGDLLSATILCSVSEIVQSVMANRHGFEKILFERMTTPSSEVLKIKEKIKEWMSSNSDRPNWGIGCHFLQLNLNTSTELRDQVPLHLQFPYLNQCDDCIEVKQEIETICLDD